MRARDTIYTQAANPKCRKANTLEAFFFLAPDP
jgi:hypothetical protein